MANSSDTVSKIEDFIVARILGANSSNPMLEIEDFIIAKTQEYQPNLRFEAAWHTARDAVSLLEEHVKDAARNVASLVEKQINEH